MRQTPERITAENIKQAAGSVATKQKTKEEAELPYECEICGKRFKSAQGKSGHMNVHNVQTVDSPMEERERPENSSDWITMYAKGGRVTNPAVVEALASQKRITFIIGSDVSNNDLVYPVSINGQVFEYPVEQYVELPESVVTLIKSVHKEAELARRRGLANRSEAVRTALTR